MGSSWVIGNMSLKGYFLKRHLSGVLVAEIRKIEVQSQPGQIVHKILSKKKKPITKKGLVEWLKE
jgi:hypothetical protein